MRGLMTLSPLFLVVAFSGCGSSEKLARGREITTLRVRGGFIEIRAGSNGKTYTLLDAEEKLIASDLTAEDLKARYPDRFEALERGLAGDGALIDASVPIPAFDASLGEPKEGTRQLRTFPLDASRDPR